MVHCKIEKKIAELTNYLIPAILNKTSKKQINNNISGKSKITFQKLASIPLSVSSAYKMINDSTEKY